MTFLNNLFVRRSDVNYKALLRRYSVLLILLGLIALFALITPRFLHPQNLMNIALQSSITAIAALGLLLPILTGGIDLSVGSTAALAGAISAGLAVRSGLPVFAVIVLGLLIGAIAGTIIGLLAVGGKLPPFVASLSLMAIARGLTLVYTEGKPISGLPEGYIALGSGFIGPFPIPVFFLIIMAAAVHVLLTYTRYGHHIYAVAGKDDTARLAGIAAGPMTVSVYTLSGFFSAFAGILLTARLWSAQPTAGIGLELEAIATVVLGGASLMGGYGNAGGTVVGAMIMGVIGNGLNLMKISSYVQQIIKGLILVAAVMIDIHSRSSQNRKKMKLV